MQERNRWLQLVSMLLVAAIVGVGVLLFARVRLPGGDLSLNEFVETLDASISSAVFIGAALVYLASIERRLKRTRALQVLHALRGLAHVVDMHQLTKDPDVMFAGGASTEHSPKRTLTPFLMGRYLDYCTELLAILGKIAAIYGQALDDGVALSAVDQVEDLTTSLSRKIWQKVMMLDQHQIRPTP